MRLLAVDVPRLTAATDAADPREALALLPAASPCGGDQDKGRALAGNEAIWNCTGLQSAFAVERSPATGGNCCSAAFGLGARSKVPFSTTYSVSTPVSSASTLTSGTNGLLFAVSVRRSA